MPWVCTTKPSTSARRYTLRIPERAAASLNRGNASRESIYAVEVLMNPARRFNPDSCRGK